jgi:hypothetical protein
MGLYNFKTRFVPFILDGTKTHTIRAPRAHVDTPGNICHLYTGLRQRGARLLGRYPCKKVETFLIADKQLYETDDPHYKFGLWINEVELSIDEMILLAWNDGFRSNGVDGAFREFMQFWSDRPLPWCGHIIHWDFRKPVKKS